MPPSSPIEPLAVLRNYWKLIGVAGLAGAAAGVVAARVVPEKYDVEDVLLVGSVAADPLRPGTRLPLQPPDETIAWIKSPGTITSFVGEKRAREEFEVIAEQEGGWMIRVHVKARDKAAAGALCESLLSRVESDHRVIYDAWQKQAAVLQASLEKRTDGQVTTAIVHTDSGIILTGEQLANVVATSRGSVFSRPTARVAPPWIARSSRQASRIAIGGFLAGVALAWGLAFALSASRPRA